MAPKIFATGVSGYIGGAALDAIVSAHPDYEITALVRDPKKATAITAKYPNVKTVDGNLDSGSIIEEESSKADIVLHFADCDHVPSAKSIVAGLSKRTGTSYLIHTSGSAILIDLTQTEKLGKVDSKVFDDIKDVAEITSFSEAEHPHRNVDKIVIEANSATLKVAIVCPPTIYGEGAGTGNTRSNQVPNITSQILTRKGGFQLADGTAIWSNVHVRDLANLYLLLTEDAVAGGKKASWGPEGYYLAENGQHAWGKLAATIATKAKALGYLKSDAVDTLSNEEILKMHPWGPVLWGSNSRSVASRARKELGWTPTSPSLDETLDFVIKQEAKKLGL
ncbi:hypothetical protein Q9L58_000735 [Maublancomyces gigas]|uniref:NAD-dependent epimerase/dehydratase domain-containing protein n=1 Tax=Discina gigas TaxID=1032678 RepID=A0ABR3GWA2_9PEZI